MGDAPKPQWQYLAVYDYQLLVGAGQGCVEQSVPVVAQISPIHGADPIDESVTAVATMATIAKAVNR